MKLGAVDFIQKPFAPKEIRELVTRVLDRDLLQAETAKDYRIARRAGEEVHPRARVRRGGRARAPGDRRRRVAGRRRSTCSERSSRSGGDRLGGAEELPRRARARPDLRPRAAEPRIAPCRCVPRVPSRSATRRGAGTSTGRRGHDAAAALRRDRRLRTARLAPGQSAQPRRPQRRRDRLDEPAFAGLSHEFSGFRVEGDATELAVLKQAKVGQGRHRDRHDAARTTSTSWSRRSRRPCSACRTCSRACANPRREEHLPRDGHRDDLPDDRRRRPVSPGVRRQAGGRSAMKVLIVGGGKTRLLPCAYVPGQGARGHGDQPRPGGVRPARPAAEGHRGPRRRQRPDHSRGGRRAGADAVLAVTPNDEDNLVICQLAGLQFGVPRSSRW